MAAAHRRLHKQEPRQHVGKGPTEAVTTKIEDVLLPTDKAWLITNIVYSAWYPIRKCMDWLAACEASPTSIYIVLEN